MRIFLQILCVCFVAVLIANSWAFRLPTYLQPKTFESSAGKYELFVDPSNLYGAGTGTYTMRSAGVILWEQELPFTLSDVIITDDGYTFGYGYTGGVESMMKFPDELILCLLDSSGAIVVNKEFERTFARYTSGTHYPWVNMMGYSDENNTAWFFLRKNDLPREDGELILINKKGEEKRDRLMILDKINEGEGHIWKVQQIPGAPLLVITWQTEGGSFTWENQRISVLDFDGKEHWRWIADDQEVRLPEVTVTDALQFSFPNKGNTVTIQVTGSGDVWSITEHSRVKLAETVNPKTETNLPINAAPLKDFPAVHLKPYRTFSLDKPAAPENSVSIRQSYLFDDAGNVYTFGNEEKDRTVRIINKQGEVIASNTIPSEGFKHNWGMDWLDHENIVMLGKTEGLDDYKAPVKLFRFDVATGELTQLGNHDFWGVSGIDASSNGRILVRSYKSKSINSGGQIRVFDRDGELLLRIDEDDFSERCGNCRIDDASLLKDGRIAVLDGNPDRVEILNIEGKKESVILLEEHWGYKPNYLSAVHAGPNGGVVVVDFNGRYPTVEMDAEGNVLHKYRKKGTIDSLGKFWVSDGYTLKQESEGGEVLGMIGSEPTDELSGPLAQFHIDQQGRMYTIPARSGIPFVFDQNGKVIYRADVPASSIQNPETAMYNLLIPGDGSMRYRVTEKVHSRDIPQREQKYVFDAQGKQVLQEELIGGTSSIEVTLRNVNLNTEQVMLNDDRIWTTTYHTVVLKDLEGTVLKEVKRDANNNWLIGPRIILQSPKGDILVSNRSSSGFTIYSSEADIIGGFDPPNLSRSSLRNSAWDGTMVFTFVEDELWVIDAQGVTVKALKVEGTNKSWQPHVTKHGKELWLFDGDREVVCLRVPDIH